MKMRILIHLLFLVVIFSVPAWSWGQIVDRPPGSSMLEEREEPRDPYLPNAYNNLKTTPAYRQTIHDASKTQTTLVTTVQVNLNASQQNIVGDAANEPSIAINPLNPSEISIGWRQFDNVASDFRQAGSAYSTDAGQTWYRTLIEPGIFRSDPVLDYDADGKFYYNSLTKDTADVYTCQVFRSANAGMAWDTGVTIGGGDKQWMTIDRSGGVGDGNIYSVWTPNFSSCYPGSFTRSANGGNSYEFCTVISGGPYWTNMAVGNAGEVYVAGVSDASQDFIVSKSTNANTPGSTISWSQSIVDLSGVLSGWTPINPVGLIGQANIDVDRSSGPGRDNVYVLASVQRTGIGDPADVMFARSTDGGNLWSAPIRLNDDAIPSNYQWFGTMSVAPNGRIDAVWLDTRDGPINDDWSALYYAFSMDAGSSWSGNEKISDLWDPHLGYAQQEKIGDYYDMVSDDNGAHLAWANTLNGGQDVYYTHIVPNAVVGTSAQTEPMRVTISPNPSKGIFLVQSTGKPVAVEVYTTLGERIFASAGFLNSREIDLSAAPSGIYCLRLSLPNGMQEVRKVIKE